MLSSCHIVQNYKWRMPKLGLRLNVKVFKKFKNSARPQYLKMTAYFDANS